MGERELDKISLPRKKWERPELRQTCQALIRPKSPENRPVLGCTRRHIITGKASELLDASASVLLKALSTVTR